jgi:hypothetical protein
MLKKLCLSAACLTAGPLLALTVNDVELNLPPSNYEWKLIADSGSVSRMLKNPLAPDDVKSVHFKLFTHREGDALEMLAVTLFDNFDDGDDEKEEKSEAPLATAQAKMDEHINHYLLNHQILINSLCVDPQTKDGVVEWEWNNGNEDLMHGFTRVFSLQQGDKTRRALLSYSTTALKSEHNRFTWTEAFNQARFISAE